MTITPIYLTQKSLSPITRSTTIHEFCPDDSCSSASQLINFNRFDIRTLYSNHYPCNTGRCNIRSSAGYCNMEEVSESESGFFSASDHYTFKGVMVKKIRVWQSAATACLVLFFIMVIVAATERSGGDTSAVTVPTTVRPTTAGPAHCNDAECVQHAALMLQMMNSSADPCNNFFNYACGNFKSLTVDVPDDEGVRTVADWLEWKNEEEIYQSIENTATNLEDTSSALQKAHVIYESCIRNIYSKRDSAYLVIDTIKTLHGGLDLFGTWNESNWDFNEEFTKVAAQQMTGAGFRFEWTPSAYEANEHTLYIRPGIVLRPALYKYTSRPFLLGQREYDSYVQLISSVMKRLAWRDGQKQNTTLLKSEQFVKDVIKVENALIDVPRHSHFEHRWLSVDLIGRAVNYTDWRKVFKEFIDEDKMKTSPRILIDNYEYLLHADDVFKKSTKREVHHFLVWSVVRHYITSLGHDYASFFLAFKQKTTDLKNTDSRRAHCRSFVADKMPYLMDMVYLNHLLGQETLSQHSNFTQFQLQMMNSSFQRWLPAENFDSLKFLMKSIKLDPSYLNWTLRQEEVDTFYSDLKADHVSFFKNIQNADRFDKEYIRKHIRYGSKQKGERSFAWRSTMLVRQHNNHITVPPGVMRPPFYNVKLPDYINVAALGSLIMEKIVYIGLITGVFKYPLEKYEKCVVNLYDGHEVTVLEYDEHGLNRHKTLIPLKINDEAQQDVLGRHYALDVAFREHANRSRNGSSLPGLKLQSEDQNFFLAYAQARCSLTDSPVVTGSRHRDTGFIPPEILTNTAVYNHQKFREAYKCKTVPDVYQKATCPLKS